MFHPHELKLLRGTQRQLNINSKYVQNHPIFAIQKDALIILGYFDDLEIANPLGSKAKIHKVGRYCYSNKGKSSVLLFVW